MGAELVNSLVRIPVGAQFRDHPLGPLMTCVPAGEFLMGGNGEAPAQHPVRRVRIAEPFAIGVGPITFNDWDICYREGGTAYLPSDRPLYPDTGQPGWGRGARPVINVCWNDAQEYCAWVSRLTGLTYRLPSEAEWEYAARAGGLGPYSVGPSIENSGLANCRNCGGPCSGSRTSEVGAHPPNAFGLYDVHGNVWEWVQDAKNEFDREGYNGAPTDGLAWEAGGRASRIMRGGSWNTDARGCTVAFRKWSTAGYRYDGGGIGFRVARDLSAREAGKSFVALSRPISQADLAHDPSFLAGLQGGVLRGHGRDLGTLLLGRFTDAAAGRAYLRAAADGVTSQAGQEEQRRAYRRLGEVGAVFLSVHLTAAGLGALGVDLAGFEVAFREGMAARRAVLNDPAPETFEPAYREAPHLAVLVACDDPETLSRAVEAACRAFAAHGITLAAREELYQHRRPDGQPIEHFGFADGVSNPVFLPDAAETSRLIDQWDSIATPRLALVPDPLAGAPDAFGSYMVLRKYRQYPERFEGAVEEVLADLGPSATETPEQQRERVAAALVGRFRDGTPLIAADTPGGAPPARNNFRFDADVVGTRCPYFAHIRKLNPRGEHEGRSDRERRIVRRGMLFGDPPKADASARRTAGGCYSGLMFLAFQASLAKQFEFIQQVWANDATFLFGRLPGPDPIVGRISLPQPGDPYPPYPALDWKGYSFPKTWGGGAITEPKPVGEVAVLLGGDYFFTPSIAGLAGLGP